MKTSAIKEYCTGCGLCAGLNSEIVLQENQKGFFVPDCDDKNLKRYSRYCVGFGNNIKQYDLKNLWGSYKKIYVGYSSDPEIRYGASSGGVLTTITAYLLENRLVDGIIHSVSSEVPWRTETVCTKDPAKLKKCMGSRYAQSSPLKDIFALAEKGKKYAFVGKPCDVAVLRNYLEDNPEKKEQFVYILSFFCAGVPSEHAEEKLIKEMGSTKQQVASLVYRGNGWPGYTTIVEKNGKELRMEYGKAWGEILGRDVHKMCRFCMDGVGELADISCGDAWYIKDGKPDFSENDGRNVIFARTQKGSELLLNVINAHKIFVDEYQSVEDLKVYQKYQYERRALMFEKILAMKFLGKSTPAYSLLELKKIKSNISIKRRKEIFWGTIKRILRKSI